MNQMNIKVLSPQLKSKYERLEVIPEVYRLSFRRLKEVDHWFMDNFGSHLKMEVATDFDVEAAKRAGRYHEENIEQLNAA